MRCYRGLMRRSLSSSPLVVVTYRAPSGAGHPTGSHPLHRQPGDRVGKRRERRALCHPTRHQPQEVAHRHPATDVEA